MCFLQKLHMFSETLCKLNWKIFTHTHTTQKDEVISMLAPMYFFISVKVFEIHMEHTTSHQQPPSLCDVRKLCSWINLLKLRNEIDLDEYLCVFRYENNVSEMIIYMQCLHLQHFLASFNDRYIRYMGGSDKSPPQDEISPKTKVLPICRWFFISSFCRTKSPFH